MIQKIKTQNISFKAFTLIELVIVLVIIWIMLMATVYFSGEQIQKVKDKTVKESILAEMQSRYSRNLWSSSYAGEIYNTMEISMKTNEKNINFRYLTGENSEIRTGFFADKFEIKRITTDPDIPGADMNFIALNYSPYNISCKIWDWTSDFKDIYIVIRVNDSRDYCFSIPQKNCRFFEMSKSKCDILNGPK